MHFELGFLTRRQFRDLKLFADELRHALPQPDLILFLKIPKRILAERVTYETHPAFIVSSLGRQISLYSDWLKGKADTNILILDNSRCELQALKTCSPTLIRAKMRFPEVQRRGKQIPITTEKRSTK
jgi:hypothetical protein